MGRYISYNDVIGRYPKSTDVGSSTFVESTYIRYSEAWVDGALSPGYSAPFSDNNLTVKDLAIDDTYMKILAFKDPEKAALIQDSLDMRVEMLLSGKAQMTLEDGTIIGKSVQTAWVETQDYTATFGVGDIIDMEVSSSRLHDEERARDND